MKKHRKLVALLIALTFLFSVAAPAMAADASDAEKAAGKLEALGIIEGYPDGSFGLDREITRAEFAKVAVIASGHGDAGDILKSTPSKFSDVKTNEWYTGWINLAASQGYVKGYPDGTFRPNDKITNAEVVTVLLRLLGYNDNLPGDWPTNYIVKAVALEITKGISFDAKAFAVRGEVFMMADKALDTEMVKWVSDDQAFEGKNEKLIAKSFEGLMEDGLVTDISWDSKGVMSAEISGSAYEVSDDAIIAGAPDMLALLGSKVDFILNDDDEIVYAGAKETKTVSDDEITIGSKKLTIDKKDYDLAEDFGVTFFPGSGSYEEGVKFSADNIVVVLDKKNNAEWVFVYEYSRADLIEEIEGDKLFGEVRTNFEYDEDDNVVIVKNGAIAGFEDLAEGDLFYLEKNIRGLDYLLIASDEKVEGVLEAASGKWDEVTVDGTKYKVDSDALVSDNEGKDFGDYDEVFSKDMVDEDITLLLSPVGKVAFAISGAKAESDDLYGIFLAADEDAFGNVKVQLVNADGKKVIYEVDDPLDEDVVDLTGGEGQTGISPKANAHELVLYRLNDDGDIVYFKAFSSFIEAEKGDGVYVTREDGNRIYINGSWKRIADDTVFFVAEKMGSSGVSKWTTASWAEFKDGFKGDQEADAIYDGNKLLAIAYHGTLVDPDNYGVIAGSGYNTKGFYYDVFFKGAKERFNTKDEPALSKVISKKTLVRFELTDGKMDKIQEIEITDPDKELVTKVGDGYFDTEVDVYYIDEDTMIVDITGSNPELAGRVVRGDYVYVYTGEIGDGDDEDTGVIDKDDGICSVVVIVPAPEVPGGPTGDVTFDLEFEDGYPLLNEDGIKSKSVTAAVKINLNSIGWDDSIQYEVTVDKSKISVSGIAARSASVTTDKNGETVSISIVVIFEDDVYRGEVLEIAAGAIVVKALDSEGNGLQTATNKSGSGLLKPQPTTGS